ncbi:hypothetical protein ACQEU6_26310 [Spirillospora sp. CA-108201]
MPSAPPRSSEASTGTGIPASFGAIIGTLTTSMRRWSAAFQCAQAASIARGPSIADQSSPGR